MGVTSGKKARTHTLRTLVSEFISHAHKHVRPHIARVRARTHLRNQYLENLFVKKILYKICSPVWTQYVISTNKRNGILTDHLLLIEASYYFEIQIHIQIHILFSKISRFVTSPQSWFLEYQHIKIRRTNVCWGARFLNPFFFSKQLVKVQKKD